MPLEPSNADKRTTGGLNNTTILIGWDGKASIEHQIEIHANDLIQISTLGGNHCDEVSEILAGLRYVLDYRLVGRRPVTLEPAICDQLVRALLLWTDKVERKGFIRLTHRSNGGKPTPNSDMAMAILADFALAVPQFVGALLTIPRAELTSRLLLSRRILKPSSDIILAASLGLLEVICQSGKMDWFDVVDEDHRVEVEERLATEGFFAHDISAYLSSSLQRQGGGTSPLELYPPSALYFDRSKERLLDMFHVSAVAGLSRERVALLRHHYGLNCLPAPKEPSKIAMLANQLTDFMIIILLVATLTSAVVDWPNLESAIILALVIVLNVGFGFWQEINSAHIMASMRSLQIPSARVRREGVDQVIPAAEVVPGDLVILAEGDGVPADLRLLDCHRLEVSESMLTGESDAVPKDPQPIILPTRKAQPTRCTGNLFMGTTVTRGSALGLAVRTGIHTEIGQIGNALQSSSESCDNVDTQLSATLHGLTKVLLLVALITCLTIFVIGLARGEDVEAMLRLGVSLAVSVIPEGLVAILTMAIALAIRRLSKEGVLVRRMNAIESLGSISVVASDKTGTLTEGKMRLVDVYTPSWNQVESDEAIMIGAICNNATLGSENDAEVGVGDAMEVAILQSASTKGIKTPPSRRLWEIPFDSERKRMSVAHQLEVHPSEMLLYCKGATESIVPRCTLIKADGQTSPLTEEWLRRIAEKEDAWSDGGRRVLAVAMRTLDSNMGNPDDSVEMEMIFCGLLAFVDPPRGGVKESVEVCEEAGIKVIMITGDHPKTAKEIARQLGIHDPMKPEKSRILHGRDLDVMTVETLASLHPFPSVFARVTPQNKLTIVKALQQRRESVLMTGDGINDAPAIKHASVGVAMGQNGAQITKDAASLVLLNDNFAAIVKTIGEGRRMYRTVTIFLMYLLSCNSAELWTILVAQALGWSPPLSPIHILWANVIADIPPSMALCMERHALEGDLMADTPHQVTSQVMSLGTWTMIAMNGLVLSALTLTVYALDRDVPLDVRRSEAFLVLIGLQLLLAPLCRSPTESIFSMGLSGNPWLWLAVALSSLLLLAGLYVPWLEELLQLTPVDWVVWVKFGIAFLIMVLVNEMLKFILRRHHKHQIHL